jgi:hypothetical protein
MTQSKNSNTSGEEFETFICDILKYCGFVKKKFNKNTLYNKNDDKRLVYYHRQHPYTNIYNGIGRNDFFIPILQLTIEAKHQTEQGSVIEKYPYIKEHLINSLYPGNKFILFIDS